MQVMTENKLLPNLRFRQFNDNWRTKLTEDLFIFKNGLNKEKEFFGRGTPIINFTDVYHLSGININDIKGLVELNNSEKDRFSANIGDVFFTRTSESIDDIGMAAVLLDDIKHCVFSGFVLRARPINNDLDLFFKKYCFSTYSVRKEIVTKSSMTTRALTSGTLLKKVKISFPSFTEQQKIATFLSAVDEKLKQLTKKKKLLSAYKKGIMQKIFSQGLRFKDDNGNNYPNWKEKRIGDVFEERNEKNFIDMELLSISIKKGIFPQSGGNKRDNSNKDKSKYKRVLKGDVAYNSMRMWQGASAVSSLNGIISPAYTVLKLNVFNNSQYFGYLFKMSFMIQTFQKNSQGMTSDTWNLKYRMISRIKVNVPSLVEQNKIANFLSSLDSKTELVNTQIENTKAFKKGLLQQMFV